MKGYSKWFLVALLGLAVFLFAGAVTSRASTEEQQAKAATTAQAQESDETPYDDVEFGAYEAATKEPDQAKRGTMLLEFIQKYPKSALMPHINSGYDGLLRELSTGKKYELLETFSERWLKIHPNDVRTLAFVAEAANNLQKYERCAECMEEIYKMQPSPTLAKEIFNSYQKINNLAKQLEWFDKLAKMSDFDSDFSLRSYFVKKYSEANNLPKAAEFAQLTLKSTDLVKNPDADTQDQLKKTRHACFHIIAMDLMEKDKYAEAIEAFKRGLKAEKYGEAYYYIGQCQERLGQDRVEDAILSYIKAELQGGEIAPKAKARAEQLYKALHNNTIIGIEKKYNKAKEELQLEK